MVNSTVQVYSFVLNINELIKSQKEDLSKIYKLRPHQFRNARPNIVNTFKTIYNDLENCIYSYEDLAIYIWYKYSIGQPINVYVFTNKETKEIQEVKKLFTVKQLEKDKEFIKDINKQLEFKSLDELFTITESGESIIYELIKKQFVSPIFFVRFFKNDLTLPKKDVSFISVDYKKFEYAMKCLIQIFKGELK